MAQRRSLTTSSFPHAEEGAVLGVGDEEEGNVRGNRAKFNPLRPSAFVGAVVLFLVLMVLMSSPNTLLGFLGIVSLPAPVAEQNKLSIIPTNTETVYEVVRQGKSEDLTILRDRAEKLVDNVRKLKNRGVVIETDAAAKVAVSAAQDAIRTLLRREYGEGPYYVDMELVFPKSMPDFDRGVVTIELAPITLVPYVVYNFLEIVKHFRSGAFHRNAGHVLQSMVRLEGHQERGLAWQEYDPHFPHQIYTLGYAGRPGGPAFYISTVDNTMNHGPASQGSKTEADGCFGKIVDGVSVVKQMMKQPGRSKPNGFISDAANFIAIASLRLRAKETI
jgi:cyclophilin family peptidyl-prolyl cis-trans isomerase